MPRKKPNPEIRLINYRILDILITAPSEFLQFIEACRFVYRDYIDTQSKPMLAQSENGVAFLGKGGGKALLVMLKKFLLSLSDELRNQFYDHINIARNRFQLLCEEWIVYLAIMIVAHFFWVPPDGETNDKRATNRSLPFFKNSSITHRIHGYKMVLPKERFDHIKHPYWKGMYRHYYENPMRTLKEVQSVWRLQGNHGTPPMPKKKRTDTEALVLAYPDVTDKKTALHIIQGVKTFRKRVRQAQQGL